MPQPFFSKVNGKRRTNCELHGLSDHAYQSTTFKEYKYNENGCHSLEYEISFGQWNLQDKCVSLKTNQKHGLSWANSPYPDYDETDDDYLARKEAQIDKIFKNIEQGDSVLMVEEVDFLFNNCEPYQKLKNILMDGLKKRNYNIEITEARTDGILNQKMATIYDANRFKVTSSKGVFPIPEGGKIKNRGFEVILEDTTKKRRSIVATNLHLKYAHDYSNAIREYQEEWCKKGLFCVLGGDTNNIQNECIDTALGDWSQATNFSSKKPYYRFGFGEIILRKIAAFFFGPDSSYELTIDHDSQGRKKAYDRYAVGPSKPDHFIEALQTERNEQVTIDEKTGEPIFSITPKKNPSYSLPGQPWERGIVALKRLLKKYKDKKDDNIQKDKLEKEIKLCIELKFRCPKNKKASLLRALDNNEITNEYTYGRDDSTRLHFFNAASTDGFEGLKEKYKNLTGDILKKSILDNFKKCVERTTSVEELEQLKSNLMNTDEYTILRTKQGLFHYSKTPTSSEKAFESFIDERRKFLTSEDVIDFNKIFLQEVC